MEIPLQEGKRGVKNLDLIVPLMGEEDSSDLRLSATNKTHQADSASARRGTSGSD